MRRLSVSLAVTVVVLLFVVAEGWKELQRLPITRVTRTLHQRKEFFSSKPVVPVNSGVLFAAALPSTRHKDRNSFVSFIQTAQAKCRSFVSFVVRRFRYLMMTFALSLSMLLGGSMARARESTPSAVSVVAARASKQPQLHRMKEMKKSRMQRQQQQQKATISNQKKVQAPSASNSNQNNNKNKASQQTSNSQKKAAAPSKTDNKEKNQAVVQTEATSSNSLVLSKEFYDKIGIAAVAASLIPLLISFQRDKETSPPSSSPSSSPKRKQITTGSTSSSSMKRPAARPIPSSQRVLEAKEDDKEEENEEEDEENDEKDEDFIDKQTQKTLSVKDYLDKKRQEVEAEDSSSGRMVNSYLRSKVSKASPSTSSRGRKSEEVSQSFEEFVEENPDVEGMVKEGARALSKAAASVNTNSNNKSNTAPKRMRGRESEEEEEEKTKKKTEEEVVVEDIPLPYAAVIAAPEESIIPESPSTALTTKTEEAKLAPPPPPPKKSGNFLTRLFQKPGGGRPSDLRSALVREKDETSPLRGVIGTGLMQYVSPEFGRRVAKEFPALTENFPPESNDVILQEIEGLSERLNLSPSDTAEIFAEVTNAFVVQLVDRAVSVLDGDSESDDVDREELQGEEAVVARQRKRVVRRLDELTDFMNGATPLFLAVVKNTASVDPLQYNGKASRQRLEEIFEVYLRETQGLTRQAMSLPFMGEQPVADASQPNVEELERLVNERNDRLAKVQFLLAIKDNKRTSLEQKLMKEMVAEMSKSFGGGGGGGGEGGSGVMGGLGDILGGLGGLGGGKGGFPGLGDKEMKEMNELMKNFKPEQLEEAMNALQSSKPEELADMLKESLKQLKDSMNAGTMSLEQIRDVEMQLGSSVEDFLSQFNSQQIGKLRQNDAFGVSDLIDTFEELSAIKKRLIAQR